MKLFKLILCITICLNHHLFVLADKSKDQLVEFRDSHQNPPRATNLMGFPLPSFTASLTTGPKGSVLLEDSTLIEHLAHFNRERIQERVVHAQGSGALGYFEVTHDISHITKAKLFSRVGKKTEILVRFSTTIGESGSPDIVHEARGFAIKFYTEDGYPSPRYSQKIQIKIAIGSLENKVSFPNYPCLYSYYILDFPGLNVPLFSIRDTILFPSMIHSRKRNPKTGLFDFTSVWDFISLRPETTMQTLLTGTSIVLPKTLRNMDGFPIHAYKMVNSNGDHVFVKFHFKTDQGLESFKPAEAIRLAGIDPDYQRRDLYNSIAEGNFPSWTLYIQMMTPRDAKSYRWFAFDPTKMWLESDFPLIPVGRLILNRNVQNMFEEMEQVGFDPGNLVPGIEVSPDRLLQGRVFAYQDALRYRLGINFARLPPNKPKNLERSYMRDGAHCVYDSDWERNGPNYFPNSFNGPWINKFGNQTQNAVRFETVQVDRYDMKDEDNFSQPRWWWNQLVQHERDLMAQSLATSLTGINPGVQARALANFDKVSTEIGDMIRARLAKLSNLKYE